MICDDEMDILDVTGMILEDAGYEVISVSDSLKAEEVFKTEMPDLLLIDCGCLVFLVIKLLLH